MRPGTVSAFLAVGIGEAARLCAQQMDEDHHRIQVCIASVYGNVFLLLLLALAKAALRGFLGLPCSGVWGGASAWGQN